MESPQAIDLPFISNVEMPPTIRRRTTARRPSAPRRDRGESDRFFRNLVAGMRNGVLAITRDGLVAEMNSEAQRIFQLKRSSTCVGRHFSQDRKSVV